MHCMMPNCKNSLKSASNSVEMAEHSCNHTIKSNIMGLPDSNHKSSVVEEQSNADTGYQFANNVEVKIEPCDDSMVKQEPLETGYNLYDLKFEVFPHELSRSSVIHSTQNVDNAAQIPDDVKVKTEHIITHIKSEPYEVEVNVPLNCTQPLECSTKKVCIDETSSAKKDIIQSHQTLSIPKENYTFNYVHKHKRTKHLHTLNDIPTVSSILDAQEEHKSIDTSETNADNSSDHPEQELYTDNIKSALKKQSLTKYLQYRNKSKKTHLCNVCNYKCGYRSLLMRHMRKHTGDKPYSCKQCDYKCADKSNFDRHQKAHNRDTHYICNVCRLVFSRKFDLITHTRDHENSQKPYVCKHCDYKCSTASDLIFHSKTHTGEMFYSCDKCEFKCVRTSNLKSHMATHSGEKPYACKHCDYRCSTIGEFLIHTRTHT